MSTRSLFESTYSKAWKCICLLKVVIGMDIMVASKKNLFLKRKIVRVAQVYTSFLHVDDPYDLSVMSLIIEVFFLKRSH